MQSMNTRPDPNSAEAAISGASRGIGIILRRYRRQFFRAREAAAGLGEGHRFNLELQWDKETGLATRITLPAEPKLMRWIMNMRPLLDPTSPIHIERVWALIKEKFPDKIRNERVVHVDAALERLRRDAPLKLVHNEREVTSAIAYEEVARNAFWASDIDAARYRNTFLNAPGVGILYEYFFYDYQLLAYQTAAALLGHVWQVEERALGLPTQCIYCLATTGDFSAEEHVIPEMFGNDEVVLPPEFACRPCNNKLAVLDAYIVDSPLGMARVYYAGPGKDGKMQRIRFQNGVLEQVNPHKVRFTQHAGKWKKPERGADGTYHFSIVGKSRKKFDAKMAARGLYKMALGMLAFKHGRTLACSPRYDEARRFIRQGGVFPNALLLFKKGEPQNPNVRLSWHFGEESYPHSTTVWIPRGTIFEINLYGARVGVNLEALPLLVPNEPAEVKWLI